jgi:uncharacterized protein YjbI with pentapeptide repeats
MSGFVNDKVFTNKDFITTPLEKAEYDSCRFVNCHFENSDLSSVGFIDCTFEDCNLTNAKLNGVSLHDVTFINCKLVGILFNNCEGFTFSPRFEGCQLNLSSFYQVNVSNVVFTKCRLHEVDFSKANLTGCMFVDCDLRSAVFSDTNLEKADLRNAYNFSIDPERNSLKKAKFSIQNVAGLLVKYGVEIE